MTPDQIKDLKKLYGNTDDSTMAAYLRVSVSEVHRVAAQLSLGKDKKTFPVRTMPRWKADETATLKELYPSMPNQEIAQRLGRTVKSVVSKAHNLKLKKTLERLTEMGQQNVKLRRDRQ